eukprot:CAMPEP_0182845160 /NCGR_PEP_ID=MMETSP0006_2-20121128/27170_1 /TAXON_ID=97485 /ORGANISM="Prymnesium parvum, Strain Texoma1" /LENGTH=30 /DNA_ID= /DNA_START= /DNA_END= /DNA_ORIENTATION=
MKGVSAGISFRHRETVNNPCGEKSTRFEEV